MPTTISQQIVGELITHEKYTFVDGKLIYTIVNDAIEEYKKDGRSEVLYSGDKKAIQDLRDIIHITYSGNGSAIVLSLASAQRIERLLNYYVRS